MNLSESLDFDTEAARVAVESDDSMPYGMCDTHYPLFAYEIIDLLKIEIARLHKMEEVLPVLTKPKSKMITAAMVIALREKTGEPMMFCKKALVSCNGDMGAADKWLQNNRYNNRIGTIY